MVIQLQNVEVLNNPAPFTSSFRFKITFDCLQPLESDLEWKLVYVGSADNADNDQELDSILVGPVRVGKNRFIFEAPAPNPSLIPVRDLLDVTVILLQCFYKNNEFVRIGYYVSNEYKMDAMDEKNQNNEMNDNPQNLPKVLDPNKIIRNILSDKPRITRFQINWDETLLNVEENKNNENENGNDNDNNNELEEEDVSIDMQCEEEDDIEEEEEEDEEDDMEDDEEYEEDENEISIDKNDENKKENTNNNNIQIVKNDETQNEDKKKSQPNSEDILMVD